MTTTSQALHATSATMTRGMVLLFAFCCGAIVANITSIFIGGAFGSSIASAVYEHGGWLGVILVGSLFPLLALLRFLLVSEKPLPASA